MLSSCKKDISGINVDTKHPAVVPSATPFSYAEKNLVGVIASTSVNLNIFKLISQQWTEVTYIDESNYDLGGRSISEGWWRQLYKYTLINLEASRKAIPNDVIDAKQRKNEIAMLDIIEDYTWYVLVNTYGNIPYKEALDPNNIFPKYDDAKTIYYDLLTRLDNDINALDVSAPSFGTADLLYAGDVPSWKKFANSLKLRMGILLADADPVKAKSTIEAAAPNAFTSNADNASFRYNPHTPNTNPVWVDAIQSGRNDFVPAVTIVDLMNTLSDPRRPMYFTPLAGSYVGGIVGKGNAWSTVSHPSWLVTKPDAPYLVMGYSEVEFILAEAVERGYNVGGTASSHYNNAITASLAYWGVSSTDAAAYLAQPSVAYLTASGNYKAKIGTQKFLSFYMDGFDAWTELKRLGYPAEVAPPDAVSGYPLRFTYPVSEQNLNSSNYTTAAAAMGGDKVENKLFWMK
ncbi:MAG: SusD/RagB family nutrient-binding outer membrane lipoprotein [Ginsengibacter sp.]